MPARFVTVTGPAGPHLRIDGGNGEPVVSSQVYDDDRSPAHAIEVICEAVDAFRAGAELLVEESAGPPASGLLLTALDRTRDRQRRPTADAPDVEDRER